MANHWYLSSVVGTADINTDPAALTKKTGAFSAMTATDVFPTLLSLTGAGTKTTPFANNDIIYVADDHSETFASDVTIGGDVDAAVGFHIMISVDATACDAYKLPASTQIDTGAYTLKPRQFHFFGVDITSADTSYGIYIVTSSYQTAGFYGVKLESTDATSYIVAVAGTGHTNVNLKNSTLTASNTGVSVFYSLLAMCHYDVDGCTFAGAASNWLAMITGNRPIDLKVKNCDFLISPSFNCLISKLFDNP